MPTKEQERKALAKIESILKELGNNPETSYVCRAFQGCVEDARENIEYDFGNSQKDRADDLEKKLEQAKAERDETREAYNALQARNIDDETRNGLYNILRYEIDTARRNAQDAAAGMLAYCENPESDEYKTALETAQKNKRRAARLEKLLQGLCKG